MSTGFIDDPFRAHRVLTGYGAKRSDRKESAPSLGVPQGCLSGGCNVLYNRIVPPRLNYIMYHACPTTPLRSMAGYIQRALTGSDGVCMTSIP